MFHDGAVFHSHLCQNPMSSAVAYPRSSWLTGYPTQAWSHVDRISEFPVRSAAWSRRFQLVSTCSNLQHPKERFLAKVRLNHCTCQVAAHSNRQFPDDKRVVKDDGPTEKCLLCSAFLPGKNPVPSPRPRKTVTPTPGREAKIELKEDNEISAMEVESLELEAAVHVTEFHISTLDIRAKPQGALRTISTDGASRVFLFSFFLCPGVVVFLSPFLFIPDLLMRVFVWGPGSETQSRHRLHIKTSFSFRNTVSLGGHGTCALCAISHSNDTSMFVFLLDRICALLCKVFWEKF